MTEPIKTPARILNEHTPLGKGYHSSWIIPAMEEYASLRVAQEREMIKNAIAAISNHKNTPLRVSGKLNELISSL